MSRKRRSNNIIDLSQEQITYENPKNVKLHSSKLFFVKSHNGILLNKMPYGVNSITILDENLEEMNFERRSVFYFDENDLRKMVLVETNQGDYEEFVFSPEKNDFVERKSSLIE